MKNLTTTVLLMLVFQLTAQVKVNTVILKSDELITYAADNFPSEKAQQIHILVETGSLGIHKESMFYIEKGIQLLLKRLQDQDKIAIGVYGEANGTVLPYETIGAEKVILEKVESLFKGTFSTENSDGIDIAHQLAKINFDKNATNTVLMIRGTGKKSENLVNESHTNAYTGKMQSVTSNNESQKETDKRTARATNHSKIGGAIALTALTILPEILEVIKD